MPDQPRNDQNPDERAAEAADGQSVAEQAIPAAAGALAQTAGGGVTGALARAGAAALQRPETRQMLNEKVKPLAAQAADDVKHAAQDAAQEIRKAAESIDRDEINRLAREAAGDVKHAAEDAAHEIRKAAEHAAEDERVQRAAQSARQAAANLQHALQAKAAELGGARNAGQDPPADD